MSPVDIVNCRKLATCPTTLLSDNRIVPKKLLFIAWPPVVKVFAEPRTAAVPVIFDGLSVDAILASVTDASVGVRVSLKRESEVTTAVPVIFDGLSVDAILASVTVPSVGVAVTVTEPPSATLDPLTLTEELASAELGTADKRAFGKVPEVMFDAFVVSVVAEVARPEIFEVAIAAEAEMSALTIVPSAIIVEVTVPVSA
jgi:hypothetical protein